MFSRKHSNLQTYLIGFKSKLDIALLYDREVSGEIYLLSVRNKKVIDWR